LQPADLHDLAGQTSILIRSGSGKQSASAPAECDPPQKVERERVGNIAFVFKLEADGERLEPDG
jgi:hypothetical protein